MSIVIDCKNKEILRLSNSLFGLLHETILELIEKNNLELTSQMNLLLTKTDQNIYGPGAVSADIDKYLKTKKEVLLLAELVKKQLNSNIIILTNLMDVLIVCGIFIVK